MYLNEPTSTLTYDEVAERLNETLKRIEERKRLVFAVTRCDANSYEVSFESLDSILDSGFGSLGNQQELLKLENIQFPDAIDIGTFKKQNDFSNKGNGGSKGPQSPKKPTYYEEGATFLGKIITVRFSGQVAYIKNVECSTISKYSDRCGSYEFKNAHLFFLAVMLQCIGAPILVTTNNLASDKPVVCRIELSPNTVFPDMSVKTLAGEFLRILKKCND